ncbi:MAG TPA: OB-fold nucleic acid binding domain-containing protein, partial [Dehalococcoidia bacterium]|nr:OB-fold nucleic acid binding domain-containing protein [Dehalococcoidia bacterium]
ALDSVAGKADARGSMLVNLDRVLSIAQSSLKLRETGQATMFDLFGAEVATPLSGIDLESASLPRGEVLAWEKELLGIWLSEHPFTRAAAHLTPLVSALCNEITPDLLPDLPAQGRDFVIAGMVGSTRRLMTRDGRAFVAAEIEDLSGTLEVTVWPDIYERTTELWLPGNIVLVQVRVRERGDRLSAGVQEVVPFDEDFNPPPWLSAPQPEPYRRNGNGNGYTNGNAHTNGAPYAASATAQPDVIEGPEPVEASEDLEARAMAIAEERGDYSAALDSDIPPEFVREQGFDPASESAEALRPAFARPEALEEPALSEPQGRGSLPSQVISTNAPLSLTLHETDDEVADQRLLASIFSLLQSHPGPDAVNLTIHTRAGDTIGLALPSARLDDALRRELQAALYQPAPTQ